MQNYQKAVEQLLKIKADLPSKEIDLQIIHTASADILTSLKGNHKEICESD
jgi:hypothetical protein